MQFPNIASKLKSATTNINIENASAPSNWQVLTATSPTTATWQTPTNERNQPRIVSAASYTTIRLQLDFATCDIFIVTAQAGALKFNNPSGTPVHLRENNYSHKGQWYGTSFDIWYTI